MTLLKIAYEKRHALIWQTLSDLSQGALSQVEEPLAADYLKAKLIKDQHSEATQAYMMARIEEFKAL